MSPTQRRYVLRETLIAVVIGCATSIGFALLVAGSREALPLWGAGGMALDFVPQTFMLSLATVIAVTVTTRKRVRAGAVKPLPPSEASLLARMPEHVVVRGLLIATLATLVFCPLATGAFVLVEVASLPTPSFVTMKALYGIALTLLLGFPVVRAALLAPVDGIQIAERSA